MISVNDFWNYLKSKEYTFFSGVPCSILEKVLEGCMHDLDIEYVPAIRENVALGLASGAYMSGKRSGILMQNSGIGNIVNALTSFNLIYKIPVLMFITWRGYGGKDAPEHIIMGKKTLSLLKELNIPTVVLSEEFKNDIDWTISRMKKSRIPCAVIIKKGLIE